MSGLEYGLGSLDIPLVLGEEKTFIFDRMVKSISFTNNRYNGGSTSRIFAEYEIGPVGDVYLVFADYAEKPGPLIGWSGGGLSAPAYPKIAEAVFYSGITDNNLMIRDGKWVLVAFQPEGNTTFNTDFYIYKMVTPKLPTKDKYGINIYNAKGDLLLHSGWKVARINNFFSSKLGGLPALESDSEVTLIGTTYGERIIDWYDEPFSAGVAKWHVGNNKLVNVGFYRKYTLYDLKTHEFPRNCYGYLSPIIRDGYLTFSVAHLETGPQSLSNAFGSGAHVVGVPDRFVNPVIVIDKPI